MTNDLFLDYFLPALKRGIKTKILIDDIDEHLLDQIKSINDSKKNNLLELSFTNQLGNFNEMVILSDNKYIIKVKYDQLNNLEATFSKEEHHVQVQETLFEKYWNEVKSLVVSNK